MQEKPSVFTPSNTSEELLEKIFVQRHKLLNKSVKWTEQSIVSDKKNHLLYIGPRGSGKTHFITMLVNRIKKQKKLHNKMVIVWLGEDDKVTSFLDLVLSVLQAMVKNYPDQYHQDCLKEISNLSVDGKAQLILNDITEQLHNKTLVLVKENLNDVFGGLKDAGQKSLRSFLQEKNNTVMVCTSQLLFKGVSSRDSAFFGFFDTYHLEPLSLDDAIQLVINIAQYNNDQELVNFLRTPLGYFRMRAIHYLAGGNHRLYIELVDFLTVESLDNLVKVLYDLVEKLTPYFQERINSLSDQQGKIIQKLCEIQGAIPVKQLAEEMIVIEERSLAKQLGQLKKINYVISHKRGKQSFYEIAEPLMRLSIEVKNSHGKPLKMIACLLRAWFSDIELGGYGKSRNSLLNQYKDAALKVDKKILIDLHGQILQEANAEYLSNNYPNCINKLSEVVNSPDTIGKPLELKALALAFRGLVYDQQNDLVKAIKDYSVLIAMEGAPIERKAAALLNRGWAYGQQNDLVKAIKDYSVLIAMEGAPIEQIAKALLNRGYAYGQQKDFGKAIKDFNALIAMEGEPIEQTAYALYARGLIYFHQEKQLDKAIDDFNIIINDPDNSKSLINESQFKLVKFYYLQLEINKAQSLLNKALDYANKYQECSPVNLKGILKAIVQLGSKHWTKEIIWFVKLFKKYQNLEFLGTALIKSIELFIEDKSFASSLEKWQMLWQEYAHEYEQMQLPLQALKAMRLAIEQKTDKPLFVLTKETRELVLPIIADAI